MKELVLYKPNKSIFNVFYKKNIDMFGSMRVINERKFLIKKYSLFLKHEIDEKKFDYYFQDYIEVLNEFVMNKVYNRVKKGVASDLEKDLLSKYYPILQLKSLDYFEYACKKQLFLINKDFEYSNISKKLVDHYTEIYKYEVSEIYNSLVKYYSDSYEKEKENKYILKIKDIIIEVSEKECITFSDSKNKFSDLMSKELYNLIGSQTLKNTEDSTLDLLNNNNENNEHSITIDNSIDIKETKEDTSNNHETITNEQPAFSSANNSSIEDNNQPTFEDYNSNKLENINKIIEALIINTENNLEITEESTQNNNDDSENNNLNNINNETIANNNSSNNETSDNDNSNNKDKDNDNNNDDNKNNSEF